jgi:hypothetical protein
MCRLILNVQHKTMMAIAYSSQQRRWRFRMLLLHGAMIVAPSAMLVAHKILGDRALGVCLFKKAFGYDCPACGITHSAIALFSGQVIESFRLNPAGPIVIGIVTILFLYFAYALVSGREGPDWRVEAKAYKILERIALVALLVGWIGTL